MRRFLPRRPASDEGFSLVESVVALVIAGIVFSALASSTVAAIRASLAGRQNQQATDFMTRELERARSLDFGALAHTAADVAGDSRLTSCAGGYCLDPDGAGPLSAEALHVNSGAGLVPHVTTPSAAEANNTAFTASTYVTEVAGTDAEDVRRVTVFITWVDGGQTKSRSTSSLVAFTQRGLPLPQYKFIADPNAVSVNPGGTVVYELSLTNQGAPDRWNITLGGPGAAQPWSLVRDTDGNGAYDPTLDTTVLVDTTADSIVDTGRIDPSSSVTFFAVWDTTASTPTGTQDTTVTATSVGQPTVAGASSTLTLSTTVTNAPIAPTPPTTVTPAPDDCPWTGTAVTATRPNNSYSVRQYTLHQDPTGATSNALPQLVMDTAAADEAALDRWSLDVDGTVLGRAVRTTSAGLTDPGVLALSDSRDYADWRQQFSGGARVGGTAALRLWVASTPSSGAALDLRAVVYAYTQSGSGYVATPIGVADVDLPASACTGLQEVHVGVSVATTTLGANDYVGLRLVNQTTGSLVRIAYDVPGAYHSRLELATK
jgi:prepilin-type N-terminal cleavage/methylation domain-containing protein